MPAALVTGASKGIGAAVARRLAQDGFDVAVHYRSDREGAEATAHEVRGAGRKDALLPADLSDPEAAWGVVDAAVAAFGGLDALVLNAGAYDRRTMQAMDGPAWRHTMAVHLDAPAAMAQAAIPALGAGPGSIVFVSSVAARRGSSHGAHYAAAKAGVMGLTRALARELAPVRVNAVAPGFIATRILAGDSAERTRQREAEVPLGRIGTPEDVAGAVSFLVGRDAAYVTGQTLDVNGGLWMS